MSTAPDPEPLTDDEDRLSNDQLLRSLDSLRPLHNATGPGPDGRPTFSGWDVPDWLMQNIRAALATPSSVTPDLREHGGWGEALPMLDQALNEVWQAAHPDAAQYIAERMYEDGWNISLASVTPSERPDGQAALDYSAGYNAGFGDATRSSVRSVTPDLAYERVTKALDSLDVIDGIVDDTHPEGDGCPLCHELDNLREVIEAMRESALASVTPSEPTLDAASLARALHFVQAMADEHGDPTAPPDESCVIDANAVLARLAVQHER